MSFKHARQWPAFLGIFFLSTYCWAAAPSANPEAIFDSCARAMGSPNGRFDVIAEGHQENAGSDLIIPLRVESRGLDDFRIERGAADQTEIAVITKGRGWHYQKDKRTQIARHTTAYFKPDHLPALMCSADYLRRGMRLAYLGEEVIGTRPVFHLRVDAAPKGKNAQTDAMESLISEYHIFIDQQSFLVVKTAQYAFSPNAIENRSLWETFYSDYRNVNGVLMPFHIENFVSGRRFSTTLFDKVSADIVLSGQEFQEPK